MNRNTPLWSEKLLYTALLKNVQCTVVRWRAVRQQIYTVQRVTGAYIDRQAMCTDYCRVYWEYGQGLRRRWRGKHKGKQEIFISKWFSDPVKQRLRQDSLIYDTCVFAYTFVYVLYIDHEPMCSIAIRCENDGNFLCIKMEDNRNLIYLIRVVSKNWRSRKK